MFACLRVYVPVNNIFQSFWDGSLGLISSALLLRTQQRARVRIEHGPCDQESEALTFVVGIVLPER